VRGLARGPLAALAALSLAGALVPLASCQSIAGFDDRHLADGGAGGAGGAAGSGGSGGSAGARVLVGKQVPGRPPQEAGSQSGDGPRAVFVLTGLSFGLLEDTPQWPTYGYNLDNSCDQASPLCGRSTTILQGDDCTDNGVGQALKLALQLESRISKIESGTNARLPVLGRTMMLELGDLNPNKDGDDAYVPGHLYLLAPAELDADGKPLPRKLDPLGLPLPIADMRTEDGSLPPARVHFPHGYLRGNVWVSGDLDEENHGPLYLPLSGEVSTPSLDRVAEMRTHQLTLTLTLDETLTTVSSSTAAGTLDVAEMQGDLLPSFAEFQDCNPKLVGNALRFLDGYADMPEPGQDPTDGCKRISLGIGLSWQKLDKPVTEVSAIPVPSTCPGELCSPGVSRCTEGGRQTCDASATWSAAAACPAEDPICVDGQCVHVDHLSASGSSMCALLSQGPPRCWGKGSYGNLGIGRNLRVGRPVAVGSLDDATDIASRNSHHVCALRKGGKVSCWGTNTSGRVGQGFGDHTVEGPYEVPGLTGATAIALGDAFSCALLAAGSVVCWGENLDGQLGNKNVAAGTPIPTPVLLKDNTPLAGIKQISAGNSHACALSTSGQLYCWGLNDLGQLGLGPGTIRQPFASLITSAPPALTAVTAGGNGTFVIDDQQTLHATGAFAEGTIAGLSPAPGQFATLSALPGTTATQVQQAATSRFSHSLLRAGGLVYGSGHNDLGQLALPASLATPCGTDMDDCDAPGACVNALTLVDLGGEVVDLVTGENHSCALFADRKVRCWGNRIHGELGDGTFLPDGVVCSLLTELHEVKW
jgi:hypothetical protein